MDRLTFDGNFCDIAQCAETPGGPFCKDGPCSQLEVWERLKAYEETGLTPEEIAEVRFLIAAQRDPRSAMERLTDKVQIGPWASLKDKSEAKPGAFADYD